MSMLNFAYIYWAYFGVAKRTNVKQKKQKNPNPNPTLKIVVQNKQSSQKKYYNGNVLCLHSTLLYLNIHGLYSCKVCADIS